MIAEAQRRGGICAFIDAEHSMDPTYARRIGVDIDQLLVSQPDTGEQALEIAELLIRSGAVDVVAVDSVAALTPKAEIEGEMGDSHVGLQARLMSQALRKLAGTLNRTDTICLFTNQLREKIGVMFGSPETTPGGRALKFYSSVRLDIRRIETLKEGTEAFGNRVRVKVVKNKVAPPFKQAEFDIIYGSGISWEGTVLDVGLERKIVTKSGSYFSLGDERLGQGRQNATAFLTENPDLVQSILARIQADAGPEQVVSARLLPSADASAGRGRAGPRGGRRGGLTEWPGDCLRAATVTAVRAARDGASPSSSTAAPWRTVRSRRPSRRGSARASARPRAGPRACARAPPASRRGRRRCARSPGGSTRARPSRSAWHAPASRRRADSEALERAERAGLVDDRRYAAARARQLADRGRGRRARRSTTSCGTGSTRRSRATAVAALEPERDRARADRRRGAGSARRTARFLAAKGFAAELVEDARCRDREPGATMSRLHPDFPALAHFRTVES